MIVKNWFELIKRAGIAPTVVHDEEQYPAELARLCELVAAAAEAREQAALRQLDRIRAISQENYDKLNGWMHACLAAEAQRDALLAALEKFMDAHEECTDFDGYTAQIVSMGDYHEAQDAIAIVKGGAA